MELKNKKLCYENINLKQIYKESDRAILPGTDTFPGQNNYLRGRCSGYLNSRWHISDIVLSGNEELKFSSLGSFKENIDKIDLEYNSFFCDTDMSLDFLNSLSEILYEKFSGIKYMENFKGSFGFLNFNEDKYVKEEFINLVNSKFPRMDNFSVDARNYNINGGSSVQELAFALSYAVEILSQISQFPRVRFCFSVSSDFFTEICKLRAVRILWSRIIDLFGGKTGNKSINLYCETSLWNKSILDPYTNVLRITTEALSAVLGNCDSLYIRPFNEITGSYDDFAHRLSSNIHYILSEEFNFTSTIDPLGGAWYIESLTNEIAEKAWSLFQEIECIGGYSQALSTGFISGKLAETRNLRKRNLFYRKDIQIGVNEFPDIREKLFENYSEETIKTGRLSDDYEKLRIASWNYKKNKGSLPGILQINYTDPIKYRARADWVRSYFSSAGIECIIKKDFYNIEEISNEISTGCNKVIVLVSLNEFYDELIKNLNLNTLKKDKYIIVAAAPEENEEKWKKFGVDDFIHIKTDNYNKNLKLLTMLGVIQ